MINVDLMRPYYLQHFHGLAFWKSATPIDYDFTTNDRFYRNMVDYRLAVLHSNQLESYAEATEEIRQVLSLLDDEMADG